MLTRRAVFASLAAATAALASFRPLSALRNPRPRDRGGYYRGFIRWRGVKGEARVWRPGYSDFLEPLPVEECLKLIMLRFKPWKYGTPPPDRGFALGQRRRRRPSAGGRHPHGPHRRQGTHRLGGQVVHRRVRGPGHLEVGDAPGLDRRVARRPATPPQRRTPALRRRRPPHVAGPVGGGLRQARNPPDPYPSGDRDRRSQAILEP